MDGEVIMTEFNRRSTSCPPLLMDIQNKMIHGNTEILMTAVNGKHY